LTILVELSQLNTAKSQQREQFKLFASKNMSTIIRLE